MSYMRVYYYENELEDEFSSASIKAKKIDADYDYSMDSAGRRFLHFFWYKIIAKPIARLFLQLKFRHRIVGLEKMEAVRERAFSCTAIIPTQVQTHLFLPWCLIRRIRM